MIDYRKLSVNSDEDSAEEIINVITQIIEIAINCKDKDNNLYDEAVYSLGSLILFLNNHGRFVFGIRPSKNETLKNNNEDIN